jgi:hypothetical protein
MNMEFEGFGLKVVKSELRQDIIRIVDDFVCSRGIFWNYLSIMGNSDREIEIAVKEYVREITAPVFKKKFNRENAACLMWDILQSGNADYSAVIRRNFYQDEQGNLVRLSEKEAEFLLYSTVVMSKAKNAGNN